MLLDDNFLAKKQMYCSVDGSVNTSCGRFSLWRAHIQDVLKSKGRKKFGVSVCVSFTLALILHLLDSNHNDYYKQMCDDGAKTVLVSSEPLMVLKCLQEIKCIQVTDSDHCDSVGYRVGSEF